MRAEQVTALRRAEVEQMRRYVEHTGCLMEFLARALDDPAPTLCGKCMNCRGQTQRQSPPSALVHLAVGFLRGDAIVLRPRARWPKPALAELQHTIPAAVGTTQRGDPSMMIPAAVRPQDGRALCLWGDAGWGREVAAGKYEHGRFSDELVEAAASLIQERWKPEPTPEWVTAVPSQRHPELVRGFAERLASRLSLPFQPVLQQACLTQPQKQMENSVTQLRNLLSAFTVSGDPPHGAVLLVDDMTDSGWTMTLLAVILRVYGSGPVHPFALAKASPRDNG
jgi:ATP-dependent DNA helicase RecQ